jgi:site-specific recombinase XerD
VFGRSLSHCEQRKPLHRSTVNLLLHKYGEKARLHVAVHPHMLRPACGFALADQGAETLLMQGLSQAPQHSALPSLRSH